MKQNNPEHRRKNGKFLAFFRYSAVLSAAMAIISLLYGAGNWVSNKLWIRDQIAAGKSNADLLPYEPPAFHVFDGVFISSAKAGSP